jgi:hypothetical protein
MNSILTRQRSDFTGRPGKLQCGSITTRVSGAAVSRPLDPLVMRFINKDITAYENPTKSKEIG